jgi:hypothetical protein
MLFFYTCRLANFLLRGRSWIERPRQLRSPSTLKEKITRAICVILFSMFIFAAVADGEDTDVHVQEIVGKSVQSHEDVLYQLREYLMARAKPSRSYRCSGMDRPRRADTEAPP